MPPAQCNRMAGLTLLALCKLRPDSEWKDATRTACTVTKSIMDYLREHYDVAYAPNTRETFRRQVLHQFIQAAIAAYNPFEPNLPTNSPRAHYAITEAALAVVKTYGDSAWQRAVASFREEQGTLLASYRRERSFNKVPVQLSTGTVLLSPGQHNELQRAVVEEFSPRFVPGGMLLYLGDTTRKHLVVDREQLTELGIPITAHDKLPDIILYDRTRNWLFFIEAVTSHGPVTPKRVIELEDLAARSATRRVYVTAFLSHNELLRHLNAVAWKTDLWVAEEPDHLTHRDGDSLFAPWPKD